VSLLRFRAHESFKKLNDNSFDPYDPVRCFILYTIYAPFTVFSSLPLGFEITNCKSEWLKLLVSVLSCCLLLAAPGAAFLVLLPASAPGAFLVLAVLVLVLPAAAVNSCSSSPSSPSAGFIGMLVLLVVLVVVLACLLSSLLRLLVLVVVSLRACGDIFVLFDTSVFTTHFSVY
jgi:hypothetical protein